MGIDHYNCDACGEIFANVEGYAMCSGCHARFCRRCTDGIELFYYAGKDRCFHCFSTEPRGLSKNAVFKYALQKLGTTREALEDEMATLPEYDAYTKPVFSNSYVCQDESPHGCEPGCTTLDEDFDVLEPPEGSDLEVVRGLCCRAKTRTDTGHDEDDWCDVCRGGASKSKKSKTK